MRKNHVFGLILAGLGAGAINGLFGAGGGMVLVPLLTLLTPLEEEEIFGSSVAIILPICIISIIATVASTPLPWKAALPYLIGSAAGGFASGIWGKNIPVKWLHKALGLLIVWGGIRYLC